MTCMHPYKLFCPQLHHSSSIFACLHTLAKDKNVILNCYFKFFLFFLFEQRKHEFISNNNNMRSWILLPHLPRNENAPCLLECRIHKTWHCTQKIVRWNYIIYCIWKSLSSRTIYCFVWYILNCTVNLCYRNILSKYQIR